MPAQSFPKRRRLRARGEFLGIQRRGRRFSRGVVTVIAARSETGQSRLGVVVSRKVGNAVERNKLKRWVREWFRKAADLPVGVDLVVMPRRQALAGNAQALWADLALLSKALAPGKLP